jgi:VanZ family protein
MLDPPVILTMKSNDAATDFGSSHSSDSVSGGWFGGLASLRPLLGLTGLFCTSLVIYASIVPLDYQPLPWEESIQRWSSIPWLELGVWERADWIANTLIFMPSAFLLCGYFFSTDRRSVFGLALKWVTIVAMLSLLVLLIELIQIWFPPRTVSWNDVAAGVAGVALGGIVWLIIGPVLGRTVVGLLQSRPLSTKAATVTALTMLICFLYSLYPFDIILSVTELEEKRVAGRLRWWTDISVAGWLSIAQSWVLAALRLFPFGVWLGWKARPFWAFLGICFMAAFFEALQVPIFSKHAAGDEVPAGIIGGLAGWLLVANAALWRKVFNQPATWFLAFAIYAILLPGLFLARSHTLVTDPQAIQERWWGMLSPPLSRYYYTSEYSALSNLAGKMGMFGVLGLLVAGYTLSRFGYARRFPVVSGFVFAATIGTMIEIFQVYHSPYIADLSDIMIYLLGYSFGAIAGFWFLADPTQEYEGSKMKIASVTSHALGQVREKA